MTASPAASAAPVRLSPAALGRSAAVTVVLVAAAGLAFRLVFRDPGAGAAIATSAGVALVVQLLMFVAARAAPPRQLFVVWVAGALVRLVALVVYALGAVRLLGLPAAPALLSLATFFFVTTLAESRLHLR